MSLRIFSFVLPAVLVVSAPLFGAAAPPPMPGQPMPGQPGSQPTPVMQMTAMPSASPSPTSTPMAAVAPPSGQAVLPRAEQWMLRVQSGQIDRSQLEPATSSQLTPALVNSMKNSYGRLGAPLSVTFLNEQSMTGGNTAYNYRVRFKHATLMEKFILDPNGKISGLSFTPSSL
jgi:hypothetical protein